MKHYFRKGIYIFLLLLGLGSSYGQVIPADSNIVIGTLENGLTYYILPNAEPQNRAELRLVVKAGSMQEDDDQLGVAHFVEHMAFNGSKNFAKNELFDYLEKVGSRFGPDLNAYTSFDETVYMLQVRTDSVDLFDTGLLVLSDWASGVSFDDEEIDKERGVVISEWRSSLSGEQRMQQNYFPIIYHNSRYAKRMPIGDPELIKNISYQRIKDFYNDWYRPDLMAVVVVGDVDISETEEKISKYFSAIPSKNNTRKKQNNTIPPHPETFISINTDPEAAFTSLRLLYKHQKEKIKTEQDYKALLVRQLYNRMLNKRLEAIAKKADPPFLFGYSGFRGDVGDLATYTCLANIPDGKVEAALQTLMTENARVLQHGFVSSELERQKTVILERMRSTVREKDNIQSRALVNRLIQNFLNNAIIPALETQLELMEKYLDDISIADVNKLASQWITDDNRVVVLTGPEKEKDNFPTEERLRQIIENTSSKDVSPYEDKVITAPLFDKKLEPVSIELQEEFSEVGVKVHMLENGIKVFTKKTNFKDDEVLFSASSKGGSSLYPDSDYMTASTASQLINESGLGPFSDTDLEKVLIGKQVGVFPYIANYHEGISGSASPKDMETMFQLIHLYFTEPRVDKESFDSFISKQSNLFKNLKSDPNFYFSDFTLKKKTNNHPRIGYPSKEMFLEIDRERALEIYRDRFADGNDFTFVFVGNFEEDTLLQFCQTYLGTLPVVKGEESYVDRKLDYVPGVISETITRGQAPKSQVELFFHGPIDYKAEHAYRLNTLLSILRIKMRESMREEKSGVYGVSINGGAVRIPKERYNITVSFNCDPANVDSLINAATLEVEKIKTDGASEEDIDKVLETQRQSLIKSLDQNRYWLSRIEDAFEQGKNPSNISLKKLEELQRGVDKESMQEAAKEFFNFENYMQFVMNPEK